MDPGRLRLVGPGMRVAARRFPPPSGTTIAALGKEIRYLAIALQEFPRNWRRADAAHRLGKATSRSGFGLNEPACKQRHEGKRDE